METFPLFSTPVFKTKLQYTPDLNYLESMEYYSYNNSGYSSANQNILLENVFADLRQQIEDSLNIFLFDILKFAQGKLLHTGSWINLHTPGDFAPKHNHTNSFYSGVFYLGVPKNSGRIWFCKPNELPTFVTSTISPDINDFNIYNSNEYGFEVETNDLLLFPSHLTHMVGENNSNYNRYSLAFNYFLQGQLGGATGQLNLRAN